MVLLQKNSSVTDSTAKNSSNTSSSNSSNNSLSNSSDNRSKEELLEILKNTEALIESIKSDLA